MTIPQDDLQLPTSLERTAHLLKERQGLTDIEIAKLMGIRRETANRYRAAFKRKVAAIRVAFPDCPCGLLAG